MFPSNLQGTDLAPQDQFTDKDCSQWDFMGQLRLEVTPGAANLLFPKVCVALGTHGVYDPLKGSGLIQGPADQLSVPEEALIEADGLIGAD